MAIPNTVGSTGGWLASFFCAAVLLVGCTSEPDGPGEWTYESGVRWASLSGIQGDGPGFQKLDSSRTGLRFVNRVSRGLVTQNRNMLHGSGVAVGDVNGDDWPDLFVTQLGGLNHLYLNRGQWRFEAVPEAGGAAMKGQPSTGTALADLDGDGDLDLVVTTMGGPNLVFHNDGTGQFEQVADAGLHSGQGSTTVALADVDGDHDPDLYIGNYKRTSLRDSLPPSEMHFNNIAQQVGPNQYEIRPEFQEDFEIGMIEGRPFLKERAEKDRLYLNDGDGRFTEQPWTDAFRTSTGSPLQDIPRHWSLVARLEDLNDDGHPDLYVCNDFESPDLLFWGTGDGQFVEAEETALRTTSHATMSIATSDIDRDGYTDFFLSDMLGRGYERRQSQMPSQMPLPHAVSIADNRVQEMQNTLQLNRGDATFAEIAELSGVEASGWTWSSRFLDVDFDGYEDLIASTGHAYDVQDPDARSRIARLESQMQSAEEKLSLIFKYPPLTLPTMAFRNRGDATFEPMPEGWGLGTTDDVGHGMAAGDFDRDGDLDLVINRLNRSLGVYRNEASQPRVALRLVGQSPNTEAIGATVRVDPLGEEAVNLPTQTQRVFAGGEYLSDSDRILSFAMGSAERALARVTWPDGDTTRVVVKPNRIYEIPEPGAQVDWGQAASDSSGTAVPDSGRVADTLDAAAASVSSPGDTSPSKGAASTTDASFSSGEGLGFEDISERLDHTHSEEKYNDFGRQPLLQRRLSQQGPGAAWADLDGDGDDDLLIGTGRGGQMAYYRNEEGRFTRVHDAVLDQTFERDLTGIVAAPHDNGATVFVGYSNYERSSQEPAQPSSILVYEASALGLERTDSLTFGPSSVGPLALADVDGDDDLDLFGGGRHAPGAYPADATSALFVNDEGTYERSPPLSRPFSKIGMVSAAAFADLDADGDPDLVLATEWGPIHYFENRRGRFIDRTEEQGFADYSGFWNGIDVADLNEDGKLDLVATNWGWNSKYGRPPGSLDAPDTPQLAHPMRAYYTDFNRDGLVELLETKYYDERDEYLPYQGFRSIIEAMPYVKQRISSFEEFSTASLKTIVGGTWLSMAETKDANTLSHMVFLNSESGFEGHPLPRWAQLAAGFSPSIADTDGDGHLDLLLSQNFFATESETPRQDAGRALLLRGDGTGRFTPVKGHHSGLLVYGEQRAAPLADIDRDGRVDALVSQNGAGTKLFRNVDATPGLRVRLDGPEDNPRGIGSIVRLKYVDGSFGPSTVLTAGSSYWSQHSLSPVFGHGDRSVAAVEVRWPDGERSEHPIEPGTRSLTVSPTQR